MISIIIPLYNKRYSFFSTIDSVLNQSYTDFELLIIDDGSTDGSLEVVKKIEDKRVRYIQKENGGVSSARNRGIKEARGEWILFLDADDYLIEDGLEHLMEATVKYPKYKVITDSNQKTIWGNNPPIVFYEKDRLDAYAEDRINIRTGNTLFHRECFDKCGLFDERLALFEDYQLFAEIVRNYPVVQIGSKVFAYETDFCGLSSVKGITEKDYLLHLKLTDDDDFNKCLYNFLGMRIRWAQAENDQAVLEYIEKHFDVSKSLATNDLSRKIDKRNRRITKLRFFMEMAHALFSGRIETKRENLLALSPSRYGKHGKNVTMGKHANMTKASKVFLYDHVCIGDNLSVYNQKGKLIIRSGTRIGNHLHVTTFDSDKNMNVVIGRNVTIGDNVSLSAGTYIHDNEVIPSNTNL